MRKRTKGVLIRLTDDEFYDLTNWAQKCGISHEQYIRGIVLEREIPRPLLPSEFHETMKQLRAIKNNLNQLTRVANKTGLIYATTYRNESITLDIEILTIRKIVSRPIESNDNNINHTEEINDGNWIYKSRGLLLPNLKVKDQPKIVLTRLLWTKY